MLHGEETRSGSRVNWPSRASSRWAKERGVCSRLQEAAAWLLQSGYISLTAVNTLARGSPHLQGAELTHSTDQDKKSCHRFQSQRRSRAKDLGDAAACHRGQEGTCARPGSQAPAQLPQAAPVSHRPLLLLSANTLDGSSLLDMRTGVSEPQGPLCEPGSEGPTRGWVALLHLSPVCVPASLYLLPHLIPA